MFCIENSWEDDFMNDYYDFLDIYHEKSLVDFCTPVGKLIRIINGVFAFFVLFNVSGFLFAELPIPWIGIVIIKILVSFFAAALFSAFLSVDDLIGIILRVLVSIVWTFVLINVLPFEILTAANLPLRITAYILYGVLFLLVLRRNGFNLLTFLPPAFTLPEKPTEES